MPPDRGPATDFEADETEHLRSLRSRRVTCDSRFDTNHFMMVCSGFNDTAWTIGHWQTSGYFSGGTTYGSVDCPDRTYR